PGHRDALQARDRGLHRPRRRDHAAQGRQPGTDRRAGEGHRRLDALADLTGRPRIIAGMTGPAFPEESATLTLEGPAGKLELAVDRADKPRPVVAVVCHPLPTEGGTMHNKVVTMAARALRECGVDTVRFNFRGVGASEGAFDQGEGESDDLRALAAWVRAQRPDAALWLAG